MPDPRYTAGPLSREEFFAIGCSLLAIAMEEYGVSSQVCTQLEDRFREMCGLKYTACDHVGLSEKIAHWHQSEYSGGSDEDVMH